MAEHAAQEKAKEIITVAPADPDAHEEEQEKLMNEDMCILVDENDQVLGNASKKTAHLMENIEKGMLHRAFSLFLFNSEGKLLLQKRSDFKPTFPGLWTNTCCSHPLFYDREMETADAIGVRRAATRKSEHELCISPSSLPPSSFHFLTRIHYQSPTTPPYGEHEIDYVLIGVADVHSEANPSEVSAIRWVNEEDVAKLLAGEEEEREKEQAEEREKGKEKERASEGEKGGEREGEEERGGEKGGERERLTPWFALIAKTLLPKWWAALREVNFDKEKVADALKPHQDHQKIVRY